MIFNHHLFFLLRNQKIMIYILIYFIRIFYMKSRKKKFIDIDIKKHEYFKKWKSINVRGNIRLISKLKIDYII